MFELSPFEKSKTKNTRNPEDVKDLNNAYDSALYGHLSENSSLGDKEELDSDQSDRIFTEAAMIAAENNRDLNEQKDYDTGMMNVQVRYGNEKAVVQRSKDWLRNEAPGTSLTKVVLEPEKVIGKHNEEIIVQKTLIEESPGRWKTEEKVISGNESSLTSENQPGLRDINFNEVEKKDSILNNSTIDPEDQKNIGTKAMQIEQARDDVAAALAHQTQ